jgi:hypothetical protein
MRRPSGAGPPTKICQGASKDVCSHWIWKKTKMLNFNPNSTGLQIFFREHNLDFRHKTRGNLRAKPTFPNRAC